MNDAVRDALAAATKALADAELARQKAAGGGGEASSFQPDTADTLSIGATDAPAPVPDPVPDTRSPGTLPDGSGLTPDDAVIGRVYADGLPHGDDSLMPPDPDNVPLADASSTTGPDGTVREAADEDEAAKKAKADRDGAQALYSPDQDRDEGGRWTGGGSAAGRHAEKTASPSGHATAANYHKAAAAFHMGEAGKSGNTPERTIEHTEAANSHAWAAHWHNEAKANPGNWTNQKIAEGASRGAHSTSREANAGNTPWAKWRTDHAETHPSQTPHRGWPTGWPGAKAAASPEEADRQALIARAEAELALDEQKLYSEDQERGPDGKWSGGGGATSESHLTTRWSGQTTRGQAAEGAMTRGAHESAREYHNAAATALGKAGLPEEHPAVDAHRNAAMAHDNASRGYATHRDAKDASKDAHSLTFGALQFHRDATDTEARYRPVSSVGKAPGSVSEGRYMTHPDLARAGFVVHPTTGQILPMDPRTGQAQRLNRLVNPRLRDIVKHGAAAERDGAEALYSEDQERDAGGRWTGGGSGEGSVAAKASSVAEHHSAASFHRAAATEHFANGFGRAGNIGIEAAQAHIAANLAHKAAADAHAAGAWGAMNGSSRETILAQEASRKAFEASKIAWEKTPASRANRAKSPIRGITKRMLQGAERDALIARAEAEMEIDRQKLYSEDQARDESGRWSSGGSSAPLGKTSSGKDVPGAGHAAYNERQKMPKFNYPVSPAIAGGHTAGQMLRQRLPGWSSQDHLDAYHAHVAAGNAAQSAWNKTADEAAQKTFGRPFEFHDYKISGIGREEFSDAHKNALRDAAHMQTAHRDAAVAHWYAAGKRTRATVAAGRSRPGLVGQSMAAAVLTDLKIVGPATDAELPPALRGKGLIRGSPVKLWPIGTSEARDGRVFVVNQTAVASLLADGNEGIAPVPFTYVHEDPEVDPELASKNAGYMTHFSADAKFIYADGIYWTKAAAADLQSGERGFVSPDAYCQPLDSDTLKPLPAGAKTTHYMPLYWRAASLVPVPALSNLPPASLSAQAAAARPTSRKESKMDRETLAALGLDESATPDQVRAAVQALKTQKLDAIPPQFLKKAHDAGEHDGKSNSDCPDCSQKAAADAGKADDAEDAKDGGADEATEKAAAKATAKAIKGAIPSIAAEAAKSAMTLVRADLKAQDAAAKIDAELETFEKAGKLVAADREFFRTMYGTNADKAREILSSRRAGAIVPDGRIESAGIDPSLSVDNLPLAEAGAILSRAAGWHMQTGKPFEMALADVRCDARDEGAFHRMVLRANPDWGKEKKTGERGVKWPTGLRKGYITSQELDTDMLKKIGQQLNAGKIPTSVIPAELQRAALERMSLAGEASNFQPPTKFQVAGFGFGYFQGEFGGSEIAVEVTGGANEEASYPVYGTEKLQVSVNASGLPEPVGRNAQDIDESVWGADFKKVTLHGYGNRVWADRRDQSAGDAVLPMGVMATVTEQALTIEKNKKELVQAATLRNVANYNTGFFKDLSGGTRQWHLTTSTPIQDWQGARVTIWRAVGAFPDLSLMPPDVVESLRFHPDFLKAAQAAGMSHIDQPEAMVPIEMLVAILGPLIVPTCRISTKPGGITPDTPWAQDVILAVTSKGKIVAPRAFATVVSSGYPMVRGLDDDKRGLNGSDGIAVSDMYTVETVGAATPSKTSAAYLFQKATIPLTVL